MLPRYGLDGGRTGVQPLFEIGVPIPIVVGGRSVGQGQGVAGGGSLGPIPGIIRPVDHAPTARAHVSHDLEIDVITLGWTGADLCQHPRLDLR